jgi:hypothetical protein
MMWVIEQKAVVMNMVEFIDDDLHEGVQNHPF